MTSVLEGGRGVSRKVDKSTDKLRDHVCDKGGRGPKNSKFSWTSLMEAPLHKQHLFFLYLRIIRDNVLFIHLLQRQFYHIYWTSASMMTDE